MVGRRWVGSGKKVPSKADRSWPESSSGFPGTLIGKTAYDTDPWQSIGRVAHIIDRNGKNNFTSNGNQAVILVLGTWLEDPAWFVIVCFIQEVASKCKFLPNFPVQSGLALSFPSQVP